MFGSISSRTRQPEISLAQLKTDDTLLITTQNSQYQFLITDHKEKRGLLSGGYLGTGTQEAELVCLADYQDDAPVQQNVRGSQVICFLLKSSSGSRQLITSPIKELKLIPASQTWHHLLRAMVDQITAKETSH